MNYFDVKDKLPPIGQMVKVFFELSVYGGHGIWWQGIRINENQFQLGSNKNNFYPIDKSDRKTLGIGVTHWADLKEENLPNLCRRHQMKQNGNCI